MIAKLCQYLVNESGSAAKIRNLLLSKARVEHENRAVLMYQWPERLRNFTLFMGELYVQLVNVSLSGP